MRILSLACAFALIACSSSSTEPNADADAGQAEDGGLDSAAADASMPVDAARADAAPVADSGAPVIGAVGTCRFEVDGVVFDSVPSDPFTTVARSGDSYTLQCVATAGDTRHTINLAFSATAPGPTAPSLGQYSTQPATGGSPDQYRAFDAVANVRDLSATAIAGTSTFVAKGASNKRVSVAFHLPLR